VVVSVKGALTTFNLQTAHTQSHKARPYIIVYRDSHRSFPSTWSPKDLPFSATVDTCSIRD
jgi:hypothetical protein